MTAGAKVTFHTEGDPGDVLFTMDTLDLMKWQLRVGDTFRYNGPAGDKHYKVESLDYILNQNPATGTPAATSWDEPTIKIGVSIVP